MKLHHHVLQFKEDSMSTIYAEIVKRYSNGNVIALQKYQDYDNLLTMKSSLSNVSVVCESPSLNLKQTKLKDKGLLLYLRKLREFVGNKSLLSLHIIDPQLDLLPLTSSLFQDIEFLDSEFNSYPIDYFLLSYENLPFIKQLLVT